MKEPKIDLNFLRLQHTLPPSKRMWVMIPDASALFALEAIIPKTIKHIESHSVQPLIINADKLKQAHPDGKKFNGQDVHFNHLLHSFAKKYLHSIQIPDIILYEWHGIMNEKDFEHLVTSGTVRPQNRAFLQRAFKDGNVPVHILPVSNGEDFIRHAHDLRLAHNHAKKTLAPLNKVNPEHLETLYRNYRDALMRHLGERLTLETEQLKKPHENVVYLSDDYGALKLMGKLHHEKGGKMFGSNVVGLLKNMQTFGFFEECGLNPEAHIPSIIEQLSLTTGDRNSSPALRHPYVFPSTGWQR